MNKLLLTCALALTSPSALILTEGRVPWGLMIEITPLDRLLERVSGAELIIGLEGDRTKVVASNEIEVLLDDAPGVVVERVCVSDGRRVLATPRGEVTLCRARALR